MLKKTFPLLCLIFTVILLVVPTISASAAGSGSVALSGPATIRSGDTITITLKLTSSNITAGEASVKYDPSQLSLVSVTPYSQGGWSLTPAHSSGTVKFGGYTTGEKWNGTKPFMTIKFKVKNLAENTPVTITTSHCVFSDGSADATLPNASYSKKISAPLSSNADLSALTVSNAVISPSFSAGTTSYTANVPFTVSKLQVAAKAADSRAKVAVKNPTLTPDGTTNVTITVTAENGAKKTYTVNVHREKDPNYVASGNNNLSGISVDGFLLSPVFSVDVTEYVVWLPYETESVKISGKAADGKAKVQVVGGDNLAAGQDNPAKVICTAENGETKEYTVIVKRAAAHDAAVEKPALESQINDDPDADPNTAGSENPNKPVGRIPWWWVIVAGVAGIAIGQIPLIVSKRKRKD